MQILHVATVVTPDGAYGGPIRVAINQLAELQSRGHTVGLAAGHHGFAGAPPSSMGGVPLHLFPVRRALPLPGFTGLASRELRTWLRRQANQVDVAHLHLTRDLMTMPAAQIFRSARTPFVAQTHGMIDESTNLLARPFDTLWTRRTLRDARQVFYLTETERDSLTAVAGPTLRLQHLVNGVPPAVAVARKTSVIEVLFLARLHRRKRPDIFVQAALALAARHPQVRFTLVGPDEGMVQTVTELIAKAAPPQQVSWEGPLPPDRTLDRIAAASIYVLPSIDEPFPMSVLEALSVGTPVVVTDTCGLAPAIAQSGAGIVVDDTVKSLTAAIDDLLTDRAARERASAQAKSLANEQFSMTAVVDQLELAYRGLLEHVRSGGRTSAGPPL
jgi:glycosyltransferase involved in cell wall biosynthesis